MQRRHYCGFILLFASALLHLFSTISSAQNTIDFSNGFNLKVVYEAGLRPWRTYERATTLRLANQKLRVLLPSASPFEIYVEIATFSVLEGNDLASADFISRPTDLMNAATLAKDICTALGTSTSGLSSSVDSYAKLRENAPTSEWDGLGQKEGVRTQVTLTPLYGPDKVLGKVYVQLQFYKIGKPMKQLKGPIVPPEGFNNLSLDPPPKDPSRKPVIPMNNDDSAFWKSVVATNLSAASPSQTPLTSPLPSSDPQKTPPIDLTSPHGESHWTWIQILLIGGTLLISVFVASRLMRK